MAIHLKTGIGLLFSWIALGQSPTILQGPWVAPENPRSSQVISWVTDMETTGEVHWGYSAPVLTGCTQTSPVAGCTINVAGQGFAFIHTWFAGPTAGNAAIYYQVCSATYPGFLIATITNAGAGYNHVPLGYLSGGGGSADISFTVSGGSITGVVLDLNNTTYFAPPTLTLTPQGGDTPSVPAVISFSVVATGSMTCSPTNSYTSGSSAVNSDPLPPAPVDAPADPTPATVFTVGADCNDPTTGLQAQLNAAAAAGPGSTGQIVEIDPTVTPYCADFDPYAVSWSGPAYLKIRVKNADTLFPNKRRVNPGCQGDFAGSAHCAAGQSTLNDKPQMAHFLHNSLNIIMGTGAPPLNCIAGNYYWRQGQGSVPALYKCNNLASAHGAYTITGVAQGYPFEVTIPHHGIPSGSSVWIAGFGGTAASAANGPFVATVADANTLELWFALDWQTLNNPINASGGTLDVTNAKLYVNKYELVAMTDSTNTPSGTCAYGSFWHLQAGTGPQDEYHRTWYCTRLGNFTSDGSVEYAWIPFRLSPGSQATPIGPFDLVTNNPSHVMLQGISIDGMNLKADPQLNQLAYVQGSYPSGSNYMSFLSIGGDHIYLDNVLMGCKDPSLTDTLMRCHQAISTGAAHVHIGGSYFYGFQDFAPLASLSDTAAQIFFSDLGGPFEIVNNYMEGACAECIMFPDDLGATTAASDLTLNQNTINRPDKYWSPTGPLLTQSAGGGIGGFYFSTRHSFEMKHLHRILADGNIFTGGWVWINSGAAICICPRGGYGNMVMVSGASIRSASDGWPFTDIQVGDRVAFARIDAACKAYSINTTYTVTAKTDDFNFTISPATSCNPTYCSGGVCSGNMTRVNASSNAVSDLLVRNTSFINQPTDIVSLGHDSYGGIITTVSAHASTVTARIKFANNLSVGLNGARIGQGEYYPGPGGCGIYGCAAPAGGHHEMSLGYEDVQHIHETIVTSTAQTPNGIFDYNVGEQGSGFVLRDSIGWSISNRGYLESDTNAINVNCPGQQANYGTALLDTTWSTPNSLGTSSTQATIGTGSFTFSVAAGLPLALSNRVQITSTNNAANYLRGYVASYDGTSLTVTIDTANGSGTWSSWTLSGMTYAYGGNVIEHASSDPYPIATCPTGPYPSGGYPAGPTYIFDSSQGFPYLDSGHGNYRIRSTSPYASGGENRATDGLDVGADMDALEAAQGRVTNVRAFGIGGGGATIGFLAPDTYGCPVDWSKDNWGTYTRAANPGGGRVQNVPLTGLPAHATISFRVNCTVMQPAGSFATP